MQRNPRGNQPANNKVWQDETCRQILETVVLDYRLYISNCSFLQNLNLDKVQFIFQVKLSNFIYFAPTTSKYSRYCVFWIMFVWTKIINLSSLQSSWKLLNKLLQQKQNIMSHELQRQIFKTNETAKKVIIDTVDWLQITIVNTMTVTVCHRTVRDKLRVKLKRNINCQQIFLIYDMYDSFI